MRLVYKNKEVIEHSALLISSYTHWFGASLLEPVLDDDLARALFEAPFAVVSHATQEDPVFNYGNHRALDLFEMKWSDFVQLPSRLSAESVEQEDRSQVMNTVNDQGYVGDYRGIRKSSSGRRFEISNASIWNVIDSNKAYYGQAAVIRKWSYL